MEQLPNYATNLALIRDGVVTNVIWGTIYQINEFASRGYVVAPYDGLFVRIGDVYRDGKFYTSDGDQIKSLPEEIADLEDYLIDALYNEIIENAEDLL